jgi:hypothetical protein
MSEAIEITSIGRSHGQLTGPIFLRAVDLLHLLEFHCARSKDWPVNSRFLTGRALSASYRELICMRAVRFFDPEFLPLVKINGQA